MTIWGAIARNRDARRVRTVCGKDAAEQHSNGGRDDECGLTGCDICENVPRNDLAGSGRRGAAGGDSELDLQRGAGR